MCLFKEFKRNFTNLMNHEKNLAEGIDRVKIAAVSEKKKFLKGGKWGESQAKFVSGWTVCYEVWWRL